VSSRPTVMIVLAALVGVAFFVTLARPSRHILRITCYFQNASGLKVGAPVALAGVEVGSVTGVRARPELREHPAEVTLLLRTAYELKIPNDSIVTLETAGVLGETFPEIEVKAATGPPIEDGGTLKTREAEGPTMQQLLDCLSNIAEHKPCKAQAKTTK
jgi:ABC-type transporter Mla subunit MlaD